MGFFLLPYHTLNLSSSTIQLSAHSSILVDPLNAFLATYGPIHVDHGISPSLLHYYQIEVALLPSLSLNWEGIFSTKIHISNDLLVSYNPQSKDMVIFSDEEVSEGSKD